MLNLTKQAAATTLHDEVSVSYHITFVQTATMTKASNILQVNRGVCNKLPPLLAALQSKVFVFHVVLTPNIITTNSPTFTVLGISDTTNPEV